MFKSLLKAAAHAALTPVAIVQDAATMGGVLTDQPETYTGRRIKKALKHGGEAIRAAENLID